MSFRNKLDRDLVNVAVWTESRGAGQPKEQIPLFEINFELGNGIQNVKFFLI